MPAFRPQPQKSILGRRLQQARERAGLAQDRVGQLAGLEESSSSARMSRYENGIHEPPLQFVQAVAKVFGLSPAYFYCNDDRLAEIIRIYSDVSEAKRELLYQSSRDLAE
jgi:transcriptional regulator with XRE-family HTH domain